MNDPSITIEIQEVHVVPDNSGVYWASGLAQPSSNDSGWFFAKYSGGKWIDMGNSFDGVDPTNSRFPAEVRPYL